MDLGLIFSRYAESLLQYAVSLGEQEEVYDKAKFLSLLFPDVPQLQRALLNPYLPPSEKKKLLLTACGGNVPPSLSGMIDLVLKNQREEAFHSIILRFIDMYREKYNIRSGVLVTATAIDRETEEALAGRIREMAHAEVEMESVVDPGIIGGFVLRLGDFRWDASVSGELARIRNKIKR